MLPFEFTIWHGGVSQVVAPHGDKVRIGKHKLGDKTKGSLGIWLRNGKVR